MTIRTSILIGFFSLSVIICRATSTSTLRGSGIGFTENKGQVVDATGNLRPDILYTGDGGSLAVFIRETGVTYVLNKVDEPPEEVLPDREDQKEINYYTHRIDLDFEGCNAGSRIIQQDKVEGYKNFYFAHCPQGITHVQSYNTLLQKNLYNNIDIVYKGSKSEGLKYDIIVNPGGDPGDIKIKYSGANNVSLQGSNLVVQTSIGDLLEYIPRVYQNIDGKIVDVECEYRFEGEGLISFKLETFNPKYALIIDPWVTYFGGSGYDKGHSIAKDPAGNIVFTGQTTSANFPLLGAYQSTLPGSAFVAKMNAAGTLLWSTFYGGSFNDRGDGICTDPNGDIYFTGETQSAGFPIVVAAGQTSFMNTFPGPGSVVAFLVKLSAATGTPLWGTFYGDASGSTRGFDVVTDQANNVILYGSTLATNNIASAGSFQPSFGGGIGFGDVFVAKFSSTGVRQWATYLGGSDSEIQGGISCDLANNIYIAGQTRSTNFPTSTAAHRSNYCGGTKDAFLFKFNSAGQRLWGTYYGGNGIDVGEAVQVDLNGDVYVGGWSTSANGIAFPATVFQPARSPGPLPGQQDAFVAKFNAAGVRQWATYLGGRVNGEYVTGLAVDNNNNIIVAGDTYSTDFPYTSCAYQTVFIGTEDQFISIFTANGNIICSGYLGLGTATSENNETINGSGGSVVAIGDFIYLVASTKCTYPVTTNAYQSGCGGNSDAAIAKLCITSCGLPNVIADFTASKLNICTGEPIDFSLTNTSCSQTGTTYTWSFHGGSPSTSTNQNATNISFSSPGTYNVKVVIETPCGKDSVEKNNYITVHGIPATVNPVSNVTCNGYNDGAANVSVPAGQYSFLWSNGQTGASATGLSAGTYSVTVSEGSGCSTVFPITITEPQPLGIILSVSDSISCYSSADGAVSVTSNGGTPNYNYSWSNNQENAIATGLSSGLYNVIVTDANGCTTSGSIQISDPQPLVASIAPNVAVCEGQLVTLSASANGGSPAYLFSWSSGSTVAVTSITPSISTTYSVEVTDKNGCSSSANTYIQVNPLPIVNFTSDEMEGCSPLCINFSNTSPTTLNSSWLFGNGISSNSNQPHICFENTGQYDVSLTITDENGCSNTKTEINYITVYPDPVASFIANPNPADINTTVLFTDKSIGAVAWDWTFGDIINSPSSEQHPSISYPDSGYYLVTLIVKNSYGCLDTTEQLLRVQPEFILFIPNSFTPNNDGKNDVFLPKGTGIDYAKYELYIFDRWGVEIFFSANPEKGWNGCVKNNNTMAQIDTYVWIVRLLDVNGNKHSYTGNINLIR